MAIKHYVITTVLLGVVFIWPHPVLSHARLWEPPGRSTMWRRGYNTPINYQDNELYCGGLSHQISQGYKCGVCGDPYDGRRENEAEGKYATGLVTRTYKQGQRVTFQVDVTANHKGYFEFKICPTNSPKVKETQKCFDLHPLSLTDGSGTKYFIPQKSAMMSVNLVLPSALACEFCVLQWRYHAGNNWGTDTSGKSCVGCGRQEEFYGCADIKILPAGSSLSIRAQQDSPRSSDTSNNADSNRREYVSSTSTNHVERSSYTNVINIRSGISSSTQGSVGLSTIVNPGRLSNAQEETATSTSSNGDQNSILTGIDGENTICRGLGGQSGLDNWCQMNCQMGFCPQTHCKCTPGQYPHAVERPQGCRASGAFDSVPGYDQWCRQNCAAGNCPSSICVC